MEWPERVEIFVERLEHESSERALSREERALMDVHETVPMLESEEGFRETRAYAGFFDRIVWIDRIDDADNDVNEVNEVNPVSTRFPAKGMVVARAAGGSQRATLRYFARGWASS